MAEREFDWIFDEEFKAKHDLELVDELKKQHLLLQNLRDLGLAQIIEEEAGCQIPFHLYYDDEKGWHRDQNRAIAEVMAANSRMKRGE